MPAAAMQHSCCGSPAPTLLLTRIGATVRGIAAVAAASRLIAHRCSKLGSCKHKKGRLTDTALQFVLQDALLPAP